MYYELLSIIYVIGFFILAIPTFNLVFNSNESLIINIFFSLIVMFFLTIYTLFATKHVLNAYLDYKIKIYNTPDRYFYNDSCKSQIKVDTEIFGSDSEISGEYERQFYKYCITNLDIGCSFETDGYGLPTGQVDCYKKRVMYYKPFVIKLLMLYPFKELNEKVIKS